MNLKVRLALLYSLSVSIILIASAITIYFLNKNFSKEEFEKKIVLEAMESGKLFFSAPKPDEVILEKLSKNTFNSFPEENIVIFDSSHTVLFSTSQSYVANIPSTFFSIARAKQRYTFSNGNIENVLLFKKTGKNGYYVFVSAKDAFGISKNENLKTLLLFSVLGGISLSGLMAFFYVQQEKKPLEELKTQIEKINEINLKDRISTGKNNNEVSQIAEQFNAMLNRLEQAFEHQKSFVHHASHELRTPLANLLLQTESALNSVRTVEEYKKILLSLKEEQHDLIDLTNSLLTLSQYEKITSVPNASLLRIDEMLYDSAEMVKKFLPHSTVTVDFETVPDNENDLIFRGNETLMRTAILNLLKNACQYSENCRIKLVIGFNDLGIELHFDNIGKQLPPEEQRKLFIPFFRGENSIYKKGYGLGLSIVQRIINLHGGNIIYQPVGKKINRFTVFLPYTK